MKFWPEDFRIMLTCILGWTSDGKHQENASDRNYFSAHTIDDYSYVQGKDKL